MAGYCTSVRPYLDEPQPSENTAQAVSIVGWNSSIITIHSSKHQSNFDSSSVCAKHMTYMRDRQLQDHYNNNNNRSSQSSQRSSHSNCSPEVRTLFQYISHNIEALGQSLVQRKPQQQWYLHSIRIATETVCYSYYVTDVLTNNLQQVISNLADYLCNNA